MFMPSKDGSFSQHRVVGENIEIIAVPQGSRDIPSYLRNRS
jgi:hypothetical protein